MGHPLGTAQPQSAQGTVWAAFSFCDYFAELAVLTFFFLRGFLSCWFLTSLAAFLFLFVGFCGFYLMST